MSDPSCNCASKAWWHKLAVRIGCGAVLWLFTAGAYAAPIYKCVDARSAVAFQDMPCAPHARQQQVAAASQPLIDAAAPRSTGDPAATAASTRRTGARSSRARALPRAKGTSKKSGAAMSWECRGANGEVFYRHTACPATVAGDGVVRERYAGRGSGTRAQARTRTDRGAWGPVPVHGTKVTRAEACRRMGAASTAGRDGHLRDARVSTYDRLMGRDPCTVD